MEGSTPYIVAIQDLFKRVAAELSESTRKITVHAYLAGGAAAHIYTQSRVSKDVDASFSPPIHVNEVVVYYIDKLGQKKSLYLDRNYFPEIGLLHPDYRDDSRIMWQMDGLILHILSPLDLAVTKLARFADHDRTDIEHLARKKLIQSAELKQRAEEALDYYVGDTRLIKYNIEDAVAMVKSINE